MQSKRSLRTDYGFINNNEFILPKTICFVTVHWYQSWGPRVHGAPNPVIWGGVPPGLSGSAAYNAKVTCMRLWSQTYRLASKLYGHKGGLLQHSSLEYFRTTVTAAAVCLQRRRSSRVLRKKVRAHNSTPPLTTSAESSRENSVPVMRSHASLPYRHRAVIPCWDSPPDCRRRLWSATSTLVIPST